MPTNPDHSPTNAQVKKRRRDFPREEARARKLPGVFEFELLVKELFDPQRGLATRKPRDCKWTHDSKRYVQAIVLRSHVEHKESVAATWGPCANVRVIDADAHDSDDPMQALPALWQAVQALHLGRGRALPDFRGTIPTHNPDGTLVQLDGVIVTTPRGLHYLERLEPAKEDTPVVDKARVKACFERYGLDVRDGVVDVLPGTSGQSRLPLGHGCAFVWPPIGKVDVVEGVQVLTSMAPVPRDFVDVQFEPPVHDADVPLDDFLACTMQDDDVPVCEYDPDEPTYPAPESTVRIWKPNNKKLVPPFYEGGGSPRKMSSPSSFTAKTKLVFEQGASKGKRNGELWDLCILLRCTYGLPRNEVGSHIREWIETAPHTSADLSRLDDSKRWRAHRQVQRLLNKIDAGLASGRFYIRQNSARRIHHDPLLLPANDDDRLALTSDGMHELLRPDGTSMLEGLPRWLQTSLPTLVGAVKRWSRSGKVVLPVRTMKSYARTRMSKRCPFTGEMRAAYAIMLEALQRFGILGGQLSAGDFATHKAAMYEINVQPIERPTVVEPKAEAPKEILVAAWPKGNGRKTATWRRSAIVAPKRQCETPTSSGERTAHHDRSLALSVRARARWICAAPSRAAVVIQV